MVLCGDVTGGVGGLFYCGFLNWGLISFICLDLALDFGLKPEHIIIL